MMYSIENPSSWVCGSAGRPDAISTARALAQFWFAALPTVEYLTIGKVVTPPWIAGGKITGDVRINGFPQRAETFNRVMGSV